MALISPSDKSLTFRILEGADYQVKVCSPTRGHTPMQNPIAADLARMLGSAPCLRNDQKGSTTCPECQSRLYQRRNDASIPESGHTHRNDRYLPITLISLSSELSHKICYTCLPSQPASSTTHHNLRYRQRGILLSRKDGWTIL